MTKKSFIFSPQTLQKIGGVSQLSYGIRVFIALCGAMALSWSIDKIDWVIPLFLGVIASALAETEDGWQARVRTLLITLVLFLLTAFGVQALMPYPWAFGSCLAVVAFSLTMTGALGRHYSVIAQATLILAVYTMIGLNQATHEMPIWYEPALLTLGALWYGILSIIWAALFVHVTLRQALSSLYVEIGLYLKLKSKFFPPPSSAAVDTLRLELAQQHGQVVVALNKVREILVSRIGSSPGNPRLGRYIRFYFIAQSIHERASSSHYNYADLADTFFHSDILFRLQRQLSESGTSCRKIGEAIRGEHAIDLRDSEEAVAGVLKSMAYLEREAQPVQWRLFRSLRQLTDNVVGLQQELDKIPKLEDESLTDASVQIPQPRVTLRSIWAQITDQFTPKSQVFRHAVRMSIALTCGYAIIQNVDIDVGYWVLLTTLFVCLPTFGSTRKRLYERIAGTVVGLVAAWCLITLFPMQPVQLVLTVVAGVVFFVTRTNRYVLATAAITLMVICCFNQVSDGYDVILPRLIDTLIGSTISWLAVFFILPDWSYRQLPMTFAEGMRRSAEYLRELMRFYQEDSVDEQVYRRSRRRAYNADALLTSTLVNMQQEPGHYRTDTELWQRLVIRSHTLFNYIAAFSAHRGKLIEQPSNRILAEASAYIVKSLEDIAQCLEDKHLVTFNLAVFEEWQAKLEVGAAEEDERHYFVQSQLQSLFDQLKEVRRLTHELQLQVHGDKLKTIS
ncbi:TIGR01666 family membrane protein [Marinomonas sp. A79]|uniref:TIGR01666 family membrane protein n=1 Tax=Marinomonas vulgaris TaxID=2823372 RepID=A0ABS5H9C9_9GAMM|nr:YccS family putative transporter [Marinomonas vulgaris]MBR7888282.1 TIGR01666 family membrane protein [Marinomonas vulgaris]